MQPRNILYFLPNPCYSKTHLSFMTWQTFSDSICLTLLHNALHFVFCYCVIFRSTSESRPNSIEGKNVRPPVHTSVRPSVHPYVRPSTKSFFNLNEIWYIARGRWLLQDNMPYGRIEGQGQGHEPFKVPSIFKIYLLHHLQRELANDH